MSVDALADTTLGHGPNRQNLPRRIEVTRADPSRTFHKIRPRHQCRRYALECDYDLDTD